MVQIKLQYASCLMWHCLPGCCMAANVNIFCSPRAKKSNVRILQACSTVQLMGGLLTLGIQHPGLLKCAAALRDRVTS
jgi:hypothetical protein